MAGALVQCARGGTVTKSWGFPLCLLDLTESPLQQTPPGTEGLCLVPLTGGELASLCYYCHRNTVTGTLSQHKQELRLQVKNLN